MKETKFYRFCPGIPWNYEDGVLQKNVSKEIWDNLILGKEVKVILPGFFLEALFVPLFLKNLKKNKINNLEIIIPSYYTPLLELFEIQNKTIDDYQNVFDEYIRLNQTCIYYPTPIFMDREGIVYFNMLYNYGKKTDWKGNLIESNNEVFWKQILQNTCCSPYDLITPMYDQEKTDLILKKFFAKYGVNSSLPYILVDNSDSKFSNYNKHYVRQVLSSKNIRDVATSVFHKKYQVIVLGGFGILDSFPTNVVRLPEWYEIKSNELFCLLLNSYMVYSSDPNIYLSSGVLGCNRIVACGEEPEGFLLNDTRDISYNSRYKKWVHKKEINIEEIISLI